jgi:predicted TIM-barrel fold metal-dependent hydrolase
VLPFGAGPETNGEFVPANGSAHDRDIVEATLAEVEWAANRAGIDRRQFLRGAGGVAAALTVFNLAACSGSSRRSGGSTTSRSTGTSAPGGSYTVPTTADVPACAAALAGHEFIFDVHSHHVMPQGPWRQTAPATVGLVGGMLPQCAAPDRFECADRAAYLHDMFLVSDTTVAMLTDVPNSGPDDAPLPFSDAVETQAFADRLTTNGAARILVHNVIAPNFGDLHARLDGMEATAATRHVAAFKVYTAWGPNRHGFALDDPAIGLPVVQKAHDVGVKVFVAHKGLPLVDFDTAHNGPEDIVAVSRVFPDMNFVVFHANWDPNHTEGPYNAAVPVGIDRLLAALDAHHVPPNSNVWVDIASVWRSLLTRPDEAAHMMGKLLTRVGEGRVMWGTDSVWYGPPQSQIMAFRAFQISPAFQERFGYPSLSDALKRKVFGLNAARLFGLDPEATRCALSRDPLTDARPAMLDRHETGALASMWRPNGPTTRREMLQWLAAPATRWTPS